MKALLFVFNAECIGGSNEDGKVIVDLNCEQGPSQVKGSHLLLATGRQPNTDHLGLEHTSIETDDRGYIQVDNQLRTTANGIWALGDCNGEGAFTHTAYNDYEIVAANLFDDNPRRLSDRITCYGLYIDPALGRVGMTEAQARESDRNVLIGKRSMEGIARAREKGETKGFMKILVDADTEQILGAAILGIEGDEIVHSIIDMMYAGEPYTTIRDAVHIHPTVSELIPTMLENLELL
ncbi:MAG: FAD-dependent oxidoreductase [Balneolaceae bacterium]|nr:FAD-dependent oxidoreductase [Balneolaceae bacterium]